MKKFKLGQTVMTRSVNEWTKETGDIKRTHRLLQLIGDSIGKHHQGDWGIVSQQDKEVNDEALDYNDRLLSAYMIEDRKIVVTEADRSVTTILFPDDY